MATDPMVADLARRIKAARRRRRLTQVELGRRLHVSGSAVSEWERGIRMPHPEQRRRLARLFAEDEAADNEDAA